MSTFVIADVISRGRASKGLTRQQLAEATGYSAVMIAKIESGERVPDHKRIPTLARALDLDPEDFERAASRSDRRKPGTSSIVEAMNLARENRARATELRERAERLRSETEAVAAQLDEKYSKFDRSVVAPLAAWLRRIADLPADLIAPAGLEPSQDAPEFSEALEAAQLNTGKSIYALTVAGLLSDDGPTGGKSVETPAFAAMASTAGVFMLRAMSGLARATADPTTLSSIARTSFDGTRGAGLTALVVLPLVAAVTNAAIESGGGRILSTQESMRRQLDEATAKFDANLRVAQKFISRATKIGEMLTVALVVARNHKRTIESVMPEGSEIDWVEAEAAQMSIRRLVEITLACLTVHALPIGIRAAPAAHGGPLSKSANEGRSVGETGFVLQAEPESEGDYIDFVIEEAFSQVAR